MIAGTTLMTQSIRLARQLRNIKQHKSDERHFWGAKHYKASEIDARRTSGRSQMASKLNWADKISIRFNCTKLRCVICALCFLFALTFALLFYKTISNKQRKTFALSCVFVCFIVYCLAFVVQIQIVFKLLFCIVFCFALFAIVLLKSNLI